VFHILILKKQHTAFIKKFLHFIHFSSIYIALHFIHFPAYFLPSYHKHQNCQQNSYFTIYTSLSYHSYFPVTHTSTLFPPYHTASPVNHPGHHKLSSRLPPLLHQYSLKLLEPHTTICTLHQHSPLQYILFPNLLLISQLLPTTNISKLLPLTSHKINLQPFTHPHLHSYLLHFPYQHPFKLATASSLTYTPEFQVWFHKPKHTHKPLHILTPQSPACISPQPITSPFIQRTPPTTPRTAPVEQLVQLSPQTSLFQTQYTLPVTITLQTTFRP